MLVWTVLVLYVSLLVIAAVVDAFSRRLPNPLALLIACVALLLVYLGDGSRALFVNLASAVLAFIVLAGFEIGWRRCHGGCAGIGMGDAKALVSLMLVEPLLALASFAIALLLLAVCCRVLRRSSMPLLPFMIPSFLFLFAFQAAGFN